VARARGLCATRRPVTPRQPAEAEAGEEGPGREGGAKEDKGEKEYYG
jgi:hypothetical protein